MKILICGLPGSGKSTLAEPLADLIGGVWLNGDQVRMLYDDWDFSKKGRKRQAKRMRYLADGISIAGRIVVADFICPTAKNRRQFDADFTVWMDTIEKGRYDDTNQLFETPSYVDYHVSAWFDDTHKQLFKVVDTWMKRNEDVECL